MKTILVLTDFSINADYVAHYALELAQNTRANLLVCNIYQVPAGEETTDRNSWPLRACEDNSIYDLGELVARLKTILDKQERNSFRPDIQQCSLEGVVGLQLNDVLAGYDILLAVISAHNSDTLGGFFARDHAWDVIDNAEFPVMVIPHQARFKPFKRIAFATLMNHSDIKVLESISGLAKYSGAEILVTHVTGDKQADHQIKAFFPPAGDSKILYREMIGFDVAGSLEQLCRDTEIDLLAIVHHRRSFLQEIFGGSITRKMAAHPGKPLLIYPWSAAGQMLTIQ